MKQHIFQYVNNLTNLMNDSQKNTFETVFRSNLVDRTSLKQLIAADIPISIYFTSLSMSLQAVQSLLDEPQSQPVGLYWNPVISATLSMASSLATGSVSIASTTLAGQKQKSGCPTKQPSAPEKKTKGKPKPKVVTPSQPSTSVVSSNKTDVSKSDDLAESISPDYNGLSALLQSGSALYTQACHSHMKCDKPLCEYCRSLFANVRITKCADFHPKSPACHASKCYPHVGASLWHRLRSSHVPGKIFRSQLNLAPPKSGTFVSLNETLLFKPNVSGASTPNRLRKRRCSEMDSISEVEEQECPSNWHPVSPEGSPPMSETSNWADDVDNPSTPEMVNQDQ